MARQFRIHPSIGIARIGNSVETFLGPERPLTFAQGADGKYRDAQKRLRRQAVRFWIFEHDETASQAAFEGEGDIAQIEWTVHLANKKANWFEFDTLKGITGDLSQGEPYPADHPLRNADFIPPSQPDERARRLVIDPGPRTLKGAGQQIEIEKGNSDGSSGHVETWPGPFVDGREITSLGSMATDAQGRLSVAGGFGVSGAIEPDGMPPDGRLNFVNNDKWFDDVSDGAVTARVTLTDGSVHEAAGAWLIVGPPDYAPPISHLVTMHDLLFDLFVRERGLRPEMFDAEARAFRADYRPSYSGEIYPILQRAFDYRWVIRQAGKHPASAFDYAALGAAPAAGEDPEDSLRFAIFDRLRDPADLNGPVDRNMPRLHNDGTGHIAPEDLRFTVTAAQYFVLRQWAAGEFDPDWAGPPVPVPANEITADGLDRAALDGGCGGGFFPGMEAGWILRNVNLYEGPFRFRHLTAEDNETGVTPGDVTKRSALPWQADFLKCGDNWWPAQRPDQVRPGPAASTSVEWSRSINGHVDLVQRWSGLGIVVPAADPASPIAFHESERELP